MSAADDYNRRGLGKVYDFADITRVVRQFQTTWNANALDGRDMLVPDGKFGPHTVSAAMQETRQTARYTRGWPLRTAMVPTGEGESTALMPEISSGHMSENPTRKPRPGYLGHHGADVMFKIVPGWDPPKKRREGRWAVPTPCPVYAYGRGEVVARGTLESGKGDMITVMHPDGLQTRYLHLLGSSIRVNVGDPVTHETILAGDLDVAGDPPHCHFECRTAADGYGYADSLNPRVYLEAALVR